MGETYWASVRFGPATKEQAQAVADLDGAELYMEHGFGDHVVTPADPTLPDIWTLTDDQASYGISQFREAMDWLREQGIAYRAEDDGKYEIPGQVEDWQPGWPAPRVRTNTPDGPALLAADWQVVCSRFADPADRARFLTDVFFREVELGP